MRITPFRLIILVIFLMVSGGAFYYLLNQYERIAYTVDVGYQGAALHNPFLAAQYLLEKQNVPVKFSRRLTPVKTQLAAHDILLLTQQQVIEEENANAILQWVENGGHLILDSYIVHAQKPSFSEADTTASDPLLSPFHIARVQQTSAQQDTFITTKINQQTLKLAFQYTTSLIRKPRQSLINWQIQTEKGLYALQFKHGQGIITVLNELSIWQNAQINDHDHAWFFWQVIHTRPFEKIWLVQTQEIVEIPENLQDLVWRHAHTLIISLSCLLFLILWRISQRFGSLLPSPPLARRRLLEHIEACGQFLWRQGQSRYLLLKCRQAVLKRLTLLHPDWQRLTPTEQIAHLQTLSLLSPTELKRALYSTDIYNEAEFTQIIKHLADLRKLI